MTQDPLRDLVQRGIESLSTEDPTLYDMLEREYRRQSEVLTMVAASSLVDPSVMVAESSLPVNVTAEGYPGARFHAGCEVVDEIESLAIERAKAAFGARYANVQPHSATMPRRRPDAKSGAFRFSSSARSRSSKLATVGRRRKCSVFAASPCIEGLVESTA